MADEDSSIWWWFLPLLLIPMCSFNSIMWSEMNEPSMYDQIGIDPYEDMRRDRMRDSLCDPEMDCGPKINPYTGDLDYECEYVYPCAGLDREEEYVDNSIPYEGEASINCEENVYNCGSFKTWSSASKVFNTCGGVRNDVHHLDGDGDSVPCESLLYEK
jgi:hypothetical protein